MSHADHRDESIEQDGLCIACRTAAEKDREEEAVASFCAPMRGPVADWFSNIITGSGFPFVMANPAGDLFYGSQELFLACVAQGKTVRLIKNNKTTPSQPDWGITFDLSTPVPVILATIKAAVEHESK